MCRTSSEATQSLVTALVTTLVSTLPQARARDCFCLTLSAVLGYAEYLLMLRMPGRSPSASIDNGVRTGISGSRATASWSTFLRPIDATPVAESQQSRSQS